MLADASLGERLMGYLPMLAQGAATSLGLSLSAICCGFVLGAALLGVSLNRGALGLRTHGVALYVSFFRGTPMLVQLLMLFYLPASLGLELPPFVSALVALSLNSAAFQCEILRAGLAAIPRDQLEAAQVFGLTPRQTFQHIQLPQIAVAVWPTLVSEAIDVLKGSAIVSVIAVTDLTRVSRQIVSGNFRPLEVYLAMAACYLLLALLIVAVGWCVKRKLIQRRPRPVRGPIAATPFENAST